MEGNPPMDDSQPRTCPKCSRPLAPNADFCRSCGARYVPSPPQPAGDGHRLEEGEQVHACPKCGASLALNAAFCRACGTPVAPATAPTQRMAYPAPQPPVPPPPPAAPMASGRGRAPFVVAALVLLLGAGAAGAVLLAKGSSETTVAVDTTATTEAVHNEEEVVESTGEEVTPSGFPTVSRAQMNEEVSALLRGYHEDVVEEDFQGAWALLSSRKRQQYMAEYGYRKWAYNQGTLNPYLSPYALKAVIVSLEDEGVARVDVTGMTWTKPGAPCSEWSGLTWVKFERGEWTYDPGYSTTSARRRIWEPRRAGLLGANCEE